MKLAWIFGSSLEAHHLLFSYVAVWLIQGGYGVWIALQWRRYGRETRAAAGPATGTRENS